MVVIVCDMCGNLVDYNTNGINIDFNGYGVVKYSELCHQEEFQVCATCANKVIKYIEGGRVKSEEYKKAALRHEKTINERRLKSK